MSLTPVAEDPEQIRPLLIYDGKCGFCRMWIEYWRQLTHGQIDYAASQDVGESYPQIQPEEFRRSVQLVLPSGQVLSGAHAVFRTLAYAPSRRWLLSAYHHVPLFATLSETAYRLVADHRPLMHSATKFLFGSEVRVLEYRGTEWLFVRLLSLIWLTAFASFSVQAEGLIGSHGVQPVRLFLERVTHALGDRSWTLLPTLFWLGATDAAVRIIPVAGCVCSLLAFFGVFWRGALFAAFLLYLSLVNASQEFLSFQWDILLLEAGFLGIFLGYSQAVVWMYRWLLFRLMFLSGAVKLLSGDESWRNLTALTFHYQTQPIPTPLAWYAHQLPALFQKMSCAGVFLIELMVPFLILAPRRLRQLSAPFLIGLQVLIILTGNYSFFNWLALSLCLFLFDDAALAKLLPGAATAGGKSFIPHRVRSVVAWSCAVVLLVLSSLHMLQTLALTLPIPASALLTIAAPYNLTSSYGLFATMTTERPEIIIEGSEDGSTWREYEFRYKPGRLDRPLPWVAPHQPRLDWQMWFAALGRYQENVWLVNLLARLLQGEPAVLRLLESNPFGERPPALVRARLYRYEFTTFESRRKTGNWWTRHPAGLYVPAISLENLSDLPILRHQPATR